MQSARQMWCRRSWRWTKTDSGVVAFILVAWLLAGISRGTDGAWHYHLHFDWTVPAAIVGGAVLIWLFGAWCARDDRKQGIDRGEPPSFSGEDSWGDG